MGDGTSWAGTANSAGRAVRLTAATSAAVMVSQKGGRRGVVAVVVAALLGFFVDDDDDDEDEQCGLLGNVVVVVVPGGGLVKAKKVKTRQNPVAKSRIAWINGCIIETTRVFYPWGLSSLHRPNNRARASER